MIKTSDFVLTRIRYVMLGLLLFHCLFYFIWNMYQWYTVEYYDPFHDFQETITYLFYRVSELFGIIGGIQCAIKGKLVLRRTFLYPIYFMFISYVFHVPKVMFSKDMSFVYTGEYSTWYSIALQVVNIIFMLSILVYFLADRGHRESGQAEGMGPVSKGHRFLNWFIDNIHMSFFYVQFVYWHLRQDFDMRDEGVTLYIYLIMICGIFVYYFVQEALFGQTIGKLHDGSFVKVYSSRPRVIFLRTVCRFIPFEPFSFLSAYSTGWHDTLSKSEVVVKGGIRFYEAPAYVPDGNYLDA